MDQSSQRTTKAQRAKQGAKRVYKLDVHTLTGGAAGMLESISAIRFLFERLVPFLALTDVGPIKLGRIISNSAQSEAGLYVTLSATEGAVVAVRCPRVATELTLTVARSSPVLRAVAWGSLALGLVLGVVAAKMLLPVRWDPETRFFAGLGIGVVIAVAAMAVLMRAGAQVLARGRSDEVVERLDTCVREWLATLPGSGVEPAPRRGKKAKAEGKRKGGSRRAVPPDNEPPA